MARPRLGAASARGLCSVAGEGRTQYSSSAGYKRCAPCHAVAPRPLVRRLKRAISIEFISRGKQGFLDGDYLSVDGRERLFGVFSSQCGNQRRERFFRLAELASLQVAVNVGGDHRCAGAALTLAPASTSQRRHAAGRHTA